MFKGDNWHISQFEKQNKTNKKLHGYNLAWGLHCQSRFDDLDFVSRSQVYQKYKLQIVCFGFLSYVV